MIARIVSGGQTGVDRAALDVARELGIPCGGWCPRGRASEDGPIDAGYTLRETPSADPRQRTEWNVRDSDATLVFTRGKPSGGTALTLGLARRLGRPCLRVDFGVAPDVAVALERVRAWLEEHEVRTLNVAGPRESQNPGLGTEVIVFLRRLLARSS